MKALILIVEDDPQIRRFLRPTLKAEGYSYFEALTASENGHTSRRARDGRTLILLDLGLPDRDGLDVIRQVRGWSQTPIVVLSARTGGGQDRGARFGADDYVAKPFGVGESWPGSRRPAAFGAGGTGRPSAAVRQGRSGSRQAICERRGSRGAPHAQRIPAARGASEVSREGPYSPAASQ